MAIISISISDLEHELLELVRDCDTYKDVGFSAYNEEDFEAALDGNTVFPAVAAIYNGVMPLGTNDNKADAASVRDSSVMLAQVQFTLVVAAAHTYGSQQDRGSLLQSLAFLDELRRKIHGYSRVNTRPWRFTGERPEFDASENGFILYTQMWRTVVPIVGLFNT